MTNPNSFYGGGHRTGSASDFVFWCLRATTIYQSRKELFVSPVSRAGEISSYGRIQNCLELAGVEVAGTYREFFDQVLDADTFISPAAAYRLRGAVLLNQGTVTVSLGDSARVIVEQNYRLVMKYVNPNIDPQSAFEYGAKVPGVAYL